MPSTAEIFGKRICEACNATKYPQNKTAAFQPSDAKFACPALNNCQAKNLSLREFWVGTCCENAYRGTYLNGKFIHKALRFLLND